MWGGVSVLRKNRKDISIRRFRRFAQILKDESLEFEAWTSEVQE